MQDNGQSKMEIKNCKVQKQRARLRIPYIFKIRLKIKRAYRIKTAKLIKYYKIDSRIEDSNNLCISRNSTFKCLITTRPHHL